MSYYYKEINPNHCEEAIKLLKHLGVCDVDENNGIITWHPSIQAGKEMYPAIAGEHFISCNG